VQVLLSCQTSVYRVCHEVCTDDWHDPRDVAWLTTAMRSMPTVGGGKHPRCCDLKPYARRQDSCRDHMYIPASTGRATPVTCRPEWPQAAGGRVGPAATVFDDFAFEGGVERFGQCVIGARPEATHGLSDAQFFAEFRKIP
jgi:hypothetical protein